MIASGINLEGEYLMENHVLIFKSSPRFHGNSSTLADHLAEGAQSVGAQTKSFDLHRMNIKPCDNCNGCQDSGKCIIQDDMEQIYPELKKATALVLASPIYWFNISGQMKLCIDRWFCYQNVSWTNFHEKKVGIILTFADPYIDTAGGEEIIKMYTNLFKYLQMPIAGIVTGQTVEPDDAKKDHRLMENAFKLGVLLGKN
jgi:multimeric flavodoxin WrbA